MGYFNEFLKYVNRKSSDNCQNRTVSEYTSPLKEEMKQSFQILRENASQPRIFCQNNNQM